MGGEWHDPLQSQKEDGHSFLRHPKSVTWWCVVGFRRDGVSTLVAFAGEYPPTFRLLGKMARAAC